MKRAFYLALAAVLALFSDFPAQATTILVDLGHEDHETATTGWNNVSGASGSGTIPSGPFILDDSTGSSTGISLSFSSTGSSGVGGVGSFYAGPYPTAVSGFPTTANQDPVYIGSGGAAGTLTATLSLLNPSFTYDFLFYGAAGNSGDTAIWTVTGQNSGSGSIIDTLNNATDVAIVSGIIPDGSNEIAILMTKPDGDLARWNVLQITVNSPVPEPSTGIVLCLGSIMLFSAARKRRRRAKSNRSLSLGKCQDISLR